MVELLDQVLLGDNAKEDFNKMYQKNDFKKWLLDILPEVEWCKNCEQDNDWHIYNCLDHILYSVQYMNELTRDEDFYTRRMLAYVMFLHDIGKPECKLRRFSKRFNRYVDSFFNHPLKSVQIADRVLDKLGFSRVDKDTMLVLIREHDIFMSFTLDKNDKYATLLTKTSLDSLLKRFSDMSKGVKLMKFLIKIGRADNMAQNPALTAPSLALLDAFENMLQKVVVV